MARKPQGIDDVAKLFVKLAKTGKGGKAGKVGVAPPKVRYQVSKAANTGLAAGKKKSSVIADKPKGPKVGKIAAVKPVRPPRAPRIAGRALPKTVAEQREAERQANRYLRMRPEPTKGKKTARNKPDGRMPIDVKGSVVKVPPKASMRPPKPAIELYEGDAFKGQIRADRNKFKNR
jgi:hypothetical protein